MIPTGLWFPGRQCPHGHPRLPRRVSRQVHHLARGVGKTWLSRGHDGQEL